MENKLNYLQTADAWMQKIQDILGRMSELTVMANDGTKSETDRASLQQEFVQMQDEIVRITTGDDAVGKFNGLNLFAGGTISQQVGADGGQLYVSSVVNLQSTNTTDEMTTLDETTYDDGAGHELLLLSNGTYVYAEDDAAATPAISAGDEFTGSPVETTNAVTYSWGDVIDGDSATGITIDSAVNAGFAVSVVNAGIDFISLQRADIGAEMKRMTQTLEGLHSYQENIAATESRIRDVDVALETTQMTKYQVLQQVGTAMLAQANQLPSQVMQLFS